MEYLNEIPVIQLVADFTEADDIIALVINHSRYNGWKKPLSPVTKTFFSYVVMMCKYTAQYKKIAKSIIKTSKYTQRTAVARAIEGDKSDNLPGIRERDLRQLQSGSLILFGGYEVADIIRTALCKVKLKIMKIFKITKN